MAKEKHIRTQGHVGQIPPWCYMQPGMTPMEGAKAAIRALGITHPWDVLLTLWKLQGGMVPRTDQPQNERNEDVFPQETRTAKNP